MMLRSQILKELFNCFGVIYRIGISKMFAPFYLVQTFTGGGEGAVCIVWKIDSKKSD
jgi:hypothetical protein